MMRWKVQSQVVHVLKEGNSADLQTNRNIYIQICLFLIMLAAFISLITWSILVPKAGSAPCDLIKQDYTLRLHGSEWLTDPKCLNLYEDRAKVRLVEHVNKTLEYKGCTKATPRCE
ncbi:hypothetical protein ACOME3_010011 [Neoechinorhynchus agilis]